MRKKQAGQGRNVALEVVDINCDMGEAFGRWRVGDTDDDVLMGLISSANIATGFHAGDPNLMDHTVRTAVQHGNRSTNRFCVSSAHGRSR